MIYAGMIAFNEEYLIGAALHSIVKHVDKVVVIDGSPWGASTDRTVEIARSFDNVVVVSGTWPDEHRQRQAYLDQMDKHHDNWCIKVDADEVWCEDQIVRLLRHMRSTSSMLLRYHSYEFWKTGRLLLSGDLYDEPNVLGTWRLTPGVYHPSYHQVGSTYWPMLWTDCDLPFMTVLKDVVFHHYGHAQSEERVREKHLRALRLGLKIRYGYLPWEEERYLRERWAVYWNPPPSLLKNILPFTGVHPPEVVGLIEGAS